jgi:hypothetical protein
MHLTRQRPSERLAERWAEHFNQRKNQIQTSKPVSKRSAPLPWDAIAFVLDTTPQVDLRRYQKLRGVLERFNSVPIYCFKSVPESLQVMLKARFGDAFGPGCSCFAVGTKHAAIVLDFKQIESCSAQLGYEVEPVAIAALLHEYGHCLADRAGLPNDETTAWGWARRLNQMHGFVPLQLLIDFENLTGEK